MQRDHGNLSDYPLLFSVDLEDFCAADPSQDFRCTEITQLVQRYLRILEDFQAKATFFVVGQVATKHPGLIETIASAGHEIGSHGNRHITLDRLGERGFYADLMASRAALKAAGITDVHGFRAPIFSLTGKTPWAHRVLADAGFLYSSSVLPAPGPLYGWPEFGKTPRFVNGVLEIPITTARLANLEIPLYGGTYFRVVPWWLVRSRCRKAITEEPLQSYFHPYDLDTDQERVLHAELRDRPAMNMLLYLGRYALPKRLEWLLGFARTKLTYADFVGSFETSR